MEKDDCAFYWGSHGCMHKQGHKGKHECGDQDTGVHSQHSGQHARYMRYDPATDAEMGWGEWVRSKPFGRDAERVGTL